VLVDKLRRVNALDGATQSCRADAAQRSTTRSRRCLSRCSRSRDQHRPAAWRDHSIISSAVKATIQGLGWRSYTAGLDALIGLVKEIKEEAKARRGAPAKSKGKGGVKR
jgi:hypothetical protein